jgi:hypothetical protein
VGHRLIQEDSFQLITALCELSKQQLKLLQNQIMKRAAEQVVCMLFVQKRQLGAPSVKPFHI